MQHGTPNRQAERVVMALFGSSVPKIGTNLALAQVTEVEDEFGMDTDWEPCLGTRD